MTARTRPRKWREGKGALYRETLHTTGFYVGRILIVPREFAPIPSPPLCSRSLRESRRAPGMRFSRHGGIYRSDVVAKPKPSKPGAGVAAFRWSAPEPQ